MKNLIIIITLLISASLYAQDNLTVTLCNQKVQKKETKKSTYNYISLTQSKLLECLELKTNDNKWHVSSFSIGFVVGSDYLELNTKGNTITEKMVETIKNHNPEKIYLEKITLLNKTNEGTRVPPLVIEIK